MEQTKKPLTLRGVDNEDRVRTPRMLALALGVATASGVCAQPLANPDEPVQDESNMIEIVEVYGEKNAPYKARRSGDLRRTADLAASPSTMTILTQSQILDSGKTDLKEILSA